MNKLFTEDDFEECCAVMYGPSPEYVANVANEKVQPLIEENERLKGELKEHRKRIRYILHSNPYPDLSLLKYWDAYRFIEEQAKELGITKFNEETDEV